jgi:hypothetical protein
VTLTVYLGVLDLHDCLEDAIHVLLSQLGDDGIVLEVSDQVEVTKAPDNLQQLALLQGQVDRSASLGSQPRVDLV